MCHHREKLKNYTYQELYNALNEFDMMCKTHLFCDEKVKEKNPLPSIQDFESFTKKVVDVLKKDGTFTDDWKFKPKRDTTLVPRFTAMMEQTRYFLYKERDNPIKPDMKEFDTIVSQSLRILHKDWKPFIVHKMV